MPIVIPNNLPAYKTLSDENVSVMDEHRASTQDIRPLEILILNLMPLKVEAETQLLRLLSNTPLQVHVTFLRTDSYQATHTPPEHLKRFYKTFQQIKQKRYDGLIITGAPLEKLDYRDVKYWKELTEIFDYAKTEVTTTFHICWAALAGLNYYYDIGKEVLKTKRFGLYKHTTNLPKDSLLRGLDPEFYIPHSCCATLNLKELEENENLEVLASSKEIGPVIVKSADDRHIFVTGHLEYDVDTLDKEYRRDLKKKPDTNEPLGYYGDNGLPQMLWRSTATLIFSNWLNYYVYQNTPYDLYKEDIS